MTQPEMIGTRTVNVSYIETKIDYTVLAGLIAAEIINANLDQAESTTEHPEYMAAAAQ